MAAAARIAIFFSETSRFSFVDVVLAATVRPGRMVVPKKCEIIQRIKSAPTESVNKMKCAKNNIDLHQLNSYICFCFFL